MGGKRELLAKLLVRSHLVHGLAGVHHGLNQDLKVLAYHRVLPRVPEAGFPYDLELVSAWSDEFDWQMQYLAEHYHVITCRELAGYMDSGVWPDKPCAMVTFDDGYLDNHDIALPILKRHGLPATIFVATGYMGSDQTFWYDRLVFEVLRTQATQLALKPGGDVVALGGTEGARRAASARLLTYLKKVPDAERLATLARWRDEMGVADVVSSSGLHRPMDWSHVKVLSDAGIEIGSHTVTHPVLSRISDADQLRWELKASKEAIEAHTGQPVLSLAYPTGGQSFNDQVIALAKEAGYRFAFTYNGGVNKRDLGCLHSLKRAAIERYTTRERFQAALAAPGFF